MIASSCSVLSQLSFSFQFLLLQSSFAQLVKVSVSYSIPLTYITAMSPKARVIYWFRTDLRLHDSPALHAALDLKPECLYPIWCWDPHYVYRARVGPNRWQFL